MYQLVLYLEVQCTLYIWMGMVCGAMIWSFVLFLTTAHQQKMNLGILSLTTSSSLNLVNNTIHESKTYTHL